MDAFPLDPTRGRDLSNRLHDARGRLRVAPACELETTTAKERLLFGVCHDLQGFPTQELVDVLRTRLPELQVRVSMLNRFPQLGTPETVRMA